LPDAANEAIAEPWRDVGGDPALLRALSVTGEGALPSAYRVTDLAVASIGAASLATAALWHDRGGPPPRVEVDRAHASAAFLSERLVRIDGREPGERWAPLSGDYATGDGRWVRIHANFDHHRDAALTALGLPLDPTPDRDAVRGAVATWDAETLVEAIMAQGGACSPWRTPEEWLAHPQGRAVASIPLVSLTRLDNAPPQPLGPASCPLEGVRVLDLSRVLAGPVCGRFLAAHGAEVLRVSGPHLPTFEVLDIDTGFGKRSCFVDLRDEAGRETLRGLAREADVFVQAYRPGAIAARGFSAADLAALRPGIVVVELCAYGHEGPWAERRGFDSLVQMATGIVATEMAAAGGIEATHAPRSLPAQALDHGTGYLAALGAVAGLRRRHAEGGSWLVRVALARTGQWLQDLGTVEGGQALDAPDASPYLAEYGTDAGVLTHVTPPGRIEGAEARWHRPPPRMGEHAAAWEARQSGRSSTSRAR
jgi:crotonobetainyl-CoA:carnitine CoA-transferase CaiB-like acyl-CoA transferase